MSAPDEFIEVKEGTHKAAHLMEALGAVFILILVVWAIFAYLHKSPFEDSSGVVPTTASLTKEEMTDFMFQKASDNPLVSDAKKVEMIEEMNRKASDAPSTSSASGVPTESAEVARERAETFEQMSQKSSSAPVVSASDRQKMIDAMNQKAQQ